MNMQLETIPETILSAYIQGHPRAILSTNSGVINQTYIVTNDTGHKYVIQRINPIFNESTVQDFMVVSKHLCEMGWQTQQLIPAKNNNSVSYDNTGQMWRALTFISGSDAPEVMSTDQLFEVGALLARLHIDLSQLEYTPKFKLSHFHDTEFYKASLAAVKNELPTEELRTIANSCMSSFDQRRPLVHTHEQLIHGDPRTTNIIFNKGHAIAYIDFDTLMHGSPWIDIGDILRSINGSNDQTTEKFSLDNTLALIRGYYSINTLGISSLGFQQNALYAAQNICIELAMRFLADIVHDSYFGWDASRFASRIDNNIARAHAQLDIYQQIDRILA